MQFSFILTLMLFKLLLLSRMTCFLPLVVGCTFGGY